MKIVINIEKKHLYFLVLFFILIGAGIIIATGWDSTKQSHSTLYSDIIRGKSGDTITVQDRLKIVDGTQGANKVLTSDANGLASWQTSLSSQWITSGSNIYYNTGNVGIGTTSPTQKLDVNGNVKGTGLCIGTDCRTSWPSSALTGTGSTNYITQWTGTNSIGASGIFESGGNVGIGTTSPESKLDVSGVVRGDRFYKTDRSTSSVGAYPIPFRVQGSFQYSCTQVCGFFQSNCMAAFTQNGGSSNCDTISSTNACLCFYW